MKLHDPHLEETGLSEDPLRYFVQGCANNLAAHSVSLGDPSFKMDWLLVVYGPPWICHVRDWEMEILATINFGYPIPRLARCPDCQFW